MPNAGSLLASKRGHDHITGALFQGVFPESRIDPPLTKRAKPLLTPLPEHFSLEEQGLATMFDLLSVLLFIAAAGLFLVRYRHENPPLAPYLLITLVSIVGAWLGNNGAGAAAVGLLIAAAFLTLHLASEPFREDSEEPR